MTSPWLPVTPLGDAEFAIIRRRVIFDCAKWDPQVGDSCVVARHPLVITRQAWDEVSVLAEALAHETMAAERELLERPDLQRAMRLPRQVRNALSGVATDGPSTGCARLMRFDFHFTTDGWQISEVNGDVPGGLNEASGFGQLMAVHYPQASSVGDPAGAYASTLTAAVGPHATIALVHATAFSDDQQMMRCIASRLQQNGHIVHLASPAHIGWNNGCAQLAADWWRGPLDLIVRFFPADWLTALPRSTSWHRFFAGSRTLLSNPATAVVTQHKRFPLIWDRLRTSLPTWRQLLPETRCPREVPWSTSDDWVIKPVLGRAGEGIWMRSLVQDADARRHARGARWWPSEWIAQRRFEITPLEIAGEAVFPCLGVYTLDGRVIGAYGRVARRPLTDMHAADAAVLAA